LGTRRTDGAIGRRGTDGAPAVAASGRRRVDGEETPLSLAALLAPTSVLTSALAAAVTPLERGAEGAAEEVTRLDEVCGSGDSGSGAESSLSVSWFEGSAAAAARASRAALAAAIRSARCTFSLPSPVASPLLLLLLT